ncbi:MAG: protein TolQ [Oligoflexia bacterium]|nr:protein TolQ [Oligoflexia bacterium]
MQSANAAISLGFIDLINQSGPVAKFVLAVLLLTSVFCWSIIFTKWLTLRRVRAENREFLDVFWHSKTIDDIMEKSGKYESSTVAAVFRSGVKELRKVSGEEMQHAGNEKVENVQRAIFRASGTEIASLENRLGWLATTASAAPFVGLFGTVWGIMDSFHNIGATGSANLAVVAPGISEALITTAVGIAAAIPAVVAYNHFAGEIRRVAGDMEGFSQDFVNIVQRSVSAASGKHKGN